MSRTRTIGLVALFIGLCLASAFGLLLWLPFGKEGASWGDLPILVSVVAAALALAALWWWAVGFAWLKAIPGWAILALPIAAHGLTAGTLIYDRVQGARYAGQTAITHYAEEPIVWPGFDGPVGYRIRLEIAHPPALKHLLHPPEIRMGPEVSVAYDDQYSVLTTGGGFFKHRYGVPDIGSLSLLKTVLFQRHFANPDGGTGIGRWSSEHRFNPAGTTALAYNLLPGTISKLHSPSQICLIRSLPGVPICEDQQTPDRGCRRPGRQTVEDPALTLGTNLSAQWLAWPSMDLGSLLTKHVRSSSALQGDVARWKQLQLRMTPAGLETAGYRICKSSEATDHQAGICYCR